MKDLHDTEHNCGPEGYPSYFPGENPFFPSGNTADSGDARYPGIPAVFPWYAPRSSDAFLETLLNIPGVAVESMEITGEGVIITVRSTVEGTRCGRCGREICRPYGHGREITLRHLSLFGNETHIRICPPRYQCVRCEGSPVTTQKASWHSQRSPHTTAYENHILTQLVSSTVGDVSVREHVGYEAVMGIIARRIELG